MECRLNFEGVASHIILKAKQSNDQIENMPTLHKNCKEKEFTALIRHLDGLKIVASLWVSLLKNI